MFTEAVRRVKPVGISAFSWSESAACRKYRQAVNVLFCYLDIPFDSTDNDTIDHPFAKEDLLVNGKGSDRRLKKQRYETLLSLREESGNELSQCVSSRR